jgi:hypothetical protein
MTPRSRDLLVAVALAAAIGAAAFVAAVTLDARFLDPVTGNDVWFEGDLGRVADEMTHRFAAHSRATVHPLFSLVGVTVTYALRLVGASFQVAVAAVVGVSAVAWTATCYALLRALGLRAPDAILFLLLSAFSASGVFWLTVPESAALGGASVMAALAVGAYASRHPVPDSWLVAASAGSLAITVTNWVAGIATAVTALPVRRAVQVLASGLAAVVVLWSIQRAVVPRGDFFIGYSNEQRYLLRDEAGGPVNALRVAVLNGMLMPRLQRWNKPGRGGILTVQNGGLHDSSGIVTAGTTIWVGLVLWGAIVLARHWRKAPAYRPLLIVLGCELVLCAVYGTETFLYVLNVVPLLVAVAACGLRSTAGRQVVRGGAVALLTIALINNAARLREARAYFTPAVAASISSMLAPTSLPSSAAFR